MAPTVDKGPLEGDYLKAPASGRGCASVRRARRAAAAPSTAEGFLFPATYELVAGAPARDLVDRAARRRSAPTSPRSTLRHAKRKNLTRYDVLIIASMVEREAQLDTRAPARRGGHLQPPARGHAARHRRDDPLRENNWTRPLSVSELERDCPYNTRLNRGLPPTPIGNPGLASIKAAANPARKDYLFYVASRATAASTRSRPPTRSSSATSRVQREREAAAASPSSC